MATATVSLGVNSTPLVQGLARAQQRIRTFGASATGVFKGLGAGLVAGGITGLVTSLSGRAFAGSITKAINLGGALRNISKSSGVAVGQLYQLSGVFEQNEMTMDDAGKALARMNKIISEAKGGTKSAVETFSSLKLNIEGLSRLNTATQFQVIAQAINAIVSPADKARYAMDIFGKSGANLIPVFQDVAKINLANVSSAGEVLQRNAELFDEVGDKMQEVKRNASGLFIGISSELLHTISGLADDAKSADFVSVGRDIGFKLSQGITETIGIAKLLSGGQKDASTEHARSRLVAGKDAYKDFILKPGNWIGNMVSGLLPEGIGFANARNAGIPDIPIKGPFQKFFKGGQGRLGSLVDMGFDKLFPKPLQGPSVPAVNPFDSVVGGAFGSLSAMTRPAQEQARTREDYHGFKGIAGDTGDIWGGHKPATKEDIDSVMLKYWN